MFGIYTSVALLIMVTLCGYGPPVVELIHFNV
jgi:hypothetical protein